MSEIFRGVGTGMAGRQARTLDKARPRKDAPVAVLISGIAIVATCFIDITLLITTLGADGLRDFINTSSRSWDLTCLFLASLSVVYFELRSGFGVMKGFNWSRWCFLGCQIASAGYLFVASWGGFYPEMYMLAGNNTVEIFYQLLLHKLPDVVILGLLFIPLSSRRFFEIHR
ncbi:YbjO family protein [Biostraticola tofi]|uniref:Uncharacterized protein DUF2593 n=1 Tax=Biostraticola tofi TaxID=466109 RepID=A0A4R3YZA8_9GAMM|nr:YbjO family protein [Biostraticola tofi]TCV98111.1 uncharacterized protein DUF2593 [Biostraticola tofi]